MARCRMKSLCKTIPIPHDCEELRHRLSTMTTRLVVESTTTSICAVLTNYKSRLRKNRLVKNILQYIFTNILYWWCRILQYIVLVVQNIAIYLQYIVLAHCPSRYYPPSSCEFIMCCKFSSSMQSRLWGTG
jgi:hypothetical protein